MALSVLSPWPPSTSVVSRDAAIACIKETIGDLSDDRANSLGEVASLLVENYADNAPQAIKNEAVIRCAGWLHQAPTGGQRSESTGDISTSYSPAAIGALRHSVAMALLSPFKIRRAGTI